MAPLILYLLAWLLLGLCFSPPAPATTLTFQWTGQAGYRLEGWLHYPDGVASGQITEQGPGPTQAIDHLEVAIYNPQGQLLDRYPNIMAGQSHNPYLRVNLNTQVPRLQGEVDLGGAEQEEWFLKGKLGQAMRLIHIDQNGREIGVDQDQGRFQSAYQTWSNGNRKT